MILRFFMMIALGIFTAGAFCGCAEFKEFMEELEEDSYSENPNSDNYKPRYVVTICTIVKYPRAGDLEQEVQGLNGKSVWINTNQNFSCLFCRNDKLILKFVWKCKRYMAKTILEKNRVGELTLPDFKTYCQPTVIRSVCCLHKNRNIEQWDRTESPKINSHL